MVKLAQPKNEGGGEWKNHFCQAKPGLSQKIKEGFKGPLLNIQ